jgi:hypothetical protein
VAGSKQTHVLCAHCNQPVDVNKYVIDPPAEWSSSSIIHLRTLEAGEAGFLGAVRCPQCRHFTIYSRD